MVMQVMAVGHESERKIGFVMDRWTDKQTFAILELLLELKRVDP